MYDVSMMLSAAWYFLSGHLLDLINTSVSLSPPGDRQLAPLCPRPQRKGQRLDDRLWEDHPFSGPDPARRPVGRGEPGGG